MVNVRTVKNALKLNENFMQIYFSIVTKSLMKIFNLNKVPLPITIDTLTIA